MRFRINLNPLSLFLALSIPIIIFLVSFTRFSVSGMRSKQSPRNLYCLVNKACGSSKCTEAINRKKHRVMHHIKQISAFIIVFSLFMIYFHLAYYAENIFGILPAGYDRNKHLALTMWFLETNSVMAYYPGTRYLIFYPVGVHMILAIVIRIAFYIAEVFGYKSLSNGFLANWEYVSLLFCFLICFILAFYPLAVYTISKGIAGIARKYEEIGVITAVLSLLFVGDVAISEPFHNIVGNYLVGFVAMILYECIENDQLGNVKHILLLAILTTSISIIHIYSLLYEVVVMALAFTYYLIRQSIFYVRRRHRSIGKILSPIVMLPTVSFVLTSILYPEYVLGFFSYLCRLSYQKSVYTNLQKDSLTKLWTSTGILSIERFLVDLKYILKGMYMLSIFLSLILVLLAVILCTWGRAVLVGSIEIHKPELKSTKYMLLLLLSSALYTFVPLTPKYDIVEVRGMYFFPIILGGAMLLSYISIKEWMRDFVKVLSSSSRLLGNKFVVVRRVIKIGFLLALLLGIFLFVQIASNLAKAQINSVARGRIIGYINMDDVYKLAEKIREYVPQRCSIVYPDGGRAMELIILSMLVNNTIYFAGIYTTMPDQVELSKLYKVCNVWIRGGYYTIRINISDTRYMEIINKYSVGAIIENPLFKLDYDRIFRLFPRAMILKISRYYTLVVLNR